MVSHANDYHDAAGPTVASTSVTDSAANFDRVPYSKPTVTWNGTTMQIASNGSALDDTIMINSLTPTANNNGVVSHTTELLASVSALFGGLSPPFTTYTAFGGAPAQLYSTSVRRSSGNYILITENSAGASVVLSGTGVGVTI